MGAYVCFEEGHDVLQFHRQVDVDREGRAVLGRDRKVHHGFKLCPWLARSGVRRESVRLGTGGGETVEVGETITRTRRRLYRRWSLARKTVELGVVRSA